MNDFSNGPHRDWFEILLSLLVAAGGALVAALESPKVLNAISEIMVLVSLSYMIWRWRRAIARERAEANKKLKP